MPLAQNKKNAVENNCALPLPRQLFSLMRNSSVRFCTPGTRQRCACVHMRLHPWWDGLIEAVSLCWIEHAVEHYGPSGRHFALRNHASEMVTRGS